jgi:hypothetical protein
MDGLRATKAEIGDFGHSADAYQIRLIHIHRVLPLQRYAGATVLYFLSLTLLQNLSAGYGRAAAALCVATCRLGQRSNAGTIPCGKSR